jgi:hypothetical protein
MNTTFTYAQLADEIRTIAPLVVGLPAGVDPVKLLWAMAGNESSFGKNCTPRHEPAYDFGGRYAAHPQQQHLLEAFGTAAAYSYGPWQQMFCNAPTGFTPESFADIHNCGISVVAQLNRILRSEKPTNLAQIASCWNAGHIEPKPLPDVAAYAAELETNYAKPPVAMPPAS